MIHDFNYKLLILLIFLQVTALSSPFGTCPRHSLLRPPIPIMNLLAGPKDNALLLAQPLEHALEILDPVRHA